MNLIVEQKGPHNRLLTHILVTVITHKGDDVLKVGTFSEVILLDDVYTFESLELYFSRHRQPDDPIKTYTTTLTSSDARRLLTTTLRCLISQNRPLLILPGLVTDTKVLHYSNLITHFTPR